MWKKVGVFMTGCSGLTMIPVGNELERMWDLRNLRIGLVYNKNNKLELSDQQQITRTPMQTVNLKMQDRSG